MKVAEQKILQTAEGKVLCAGILMFISLTFIIGYYGITDVEKAKTLSLAFFAHTVGGRAAGIGLCIMSELNLVWTVIYNFYLEILIVCFTYSVFVLSLTQKMKFKWGRDFALKLMEKASVHKDKIKRYGWIGIFLFVMAPLPVTGPVIGSTIGYLLKIGLWRNLSAVFLGTLMAIIVWVIGFDYIEQHLHMAQYLLAGIVGIVICSHFRTIKKMIFKGPKKK